MRPVPTGKSNQFNMFLAIAKGIQMKNNNGRFLMSLVLGLAFSAAAPAFAGEIRGIAGKCLDVDRAQTQDGTQVQIWDCNATKAQNWTLNPKTGEIRGLAGKCLDVDHAETADGTRIQLWECNGSEAQRWRYVKGELRGIAGKCLDVDNANTESGTRVQLWTCNGTNAQSWTLLK